MRDVKNELQKLQEEIEKLKKENQALREEKKKIEEEPDFLREYAAELNESVQPVALIMKKIFAQNKIDAMAMCISNTRTGVNSDELHVTTAYLKSIEDFNEESFSAACETFANPRRLSILKLLVKEKLTASEIGQKTGLVGGQLYHHLSSLENASLIKKDGDKYESHPVLCSMLIDMCAAFGGVPTAKK
jgi:sugar-specific transcriptional regulator TrmB